MKTLVSFNKFGLASGTNNNSDEDQVVIWPCDTVPANPESDYKTPFAKVGVWFGGKMELVAKIHVVSLLMLAIAMLTFVLSAPEHSYFDYWNTDIIIARQLLTILGCLLMGIALKKSKPRLFWPFLVANGVWALGMLTLFLYCIVMGLIVYGGEFFNEINSVFAVVWYIVEMILYCYVELVFWKAYKYMARQNASQ